MSWMGKAAKTGTCGTRKRTSSKLRPEEKQEGEADGMALSRAQESRRIAALALLVLLQHLPSLYFMGLNLPHVAELKDPAVSRQHQRPSSSQDPALPTSLSSLSCPFSSLFWCRSPFPICRCLPSWHLHWTVQVCPSTPTPSSTCPLWTPTEDGFTGTAWGDPRLL